VLLGFHHCREVGVDVEQRRAVAEWEGIARRWLPPGRHGEILALPPEQRLDAFLTDWCLLEARLKARGLGMFGLEEPPPRSAVAAATGQWRVTLPRGYLGAAALA
jgi:4'-phosphopantetheinyl transferase